MLVSFLRMPSPPFGFRTDSSDLPREKRKQKRRQRKQQKQLILQMKKLKVNRGKPMTWTQVRSLTRHAKELLIELGKPPTPACYVLAFFSLLSATPLPIEGVSYWAYVPDPPIIQPVGWMDPQHIKMLTNDSLRIGGAQNSELRPSTSSFINFEGRADSLPVCLTLQGKAPHGCFTTRYRTFLTDSPDRAQLGDSSVAQNSATRYLRAPF
ncbi:endogenous retrovirus group K member 19 Env polyprotein isoform X2 [Mesocricetus auratus]|uniref:Endogenous retrovirus group K member 19 Env polyprotein isoform X2 n=1 Tax=Mesocricetus auratus TaxID=10036 RepID=A0ABM2YB97_MESAU|nr:endogenous retrovirus group K member 19 Env polyprotein isoform X2 [Mesocricetus auratus]